MAARVLLSVGVIRATGTSGPAVNLGYEPQWMMIKKSSAVKERWYIYDNMRGVVTGAVSAAERKLFRFKRKGGLALPTQSILVQLGSISAQTINELNCLLAPTST
jgi:hypothetical protein